MSLSEPPASETEYIAEEANELEANVAEEPTEEIAEEIPVLQPPARSVTFTDSAGVNETNILSGRMRSQTKSHVRMVRLPDPKNVREVMHIVNEADLWKAAIEDEYTSHIENHSFEHVTRDQLTPGIRPLRMKLILHRK